jgi:uncharacterized membrane protein YcaP (DUF421 family)
MCSNPGSDYTTLVIFAASLGNVFLPHLPWWELILRGSLTYLFLFGLLRLVQKRQAGTLGVPDLLLVLLVAHAGHNALVGEYHSLADGAILILTILFWNIALNWLGYHISFIGLLVHPSPLELVSEGEENWQNMRREFITREELMSHIRRAGAEDIGDVKGAWIEGNGHISVVTYSSTEPHKEERPAL